MNQVARCLCVAALALSAMSGCSRDGVPATPTVTEATSGPPAAAVGAAPAASVATATPAVVNANAPAPARPDHPTLVVKTFAGTAWNLADHRGRWVVVNFWATWCNPCLKEIPDLAAFDAQRKDVDVIGLAYEEIEHADMAAFLKDHPIPYPIAVLDVYSPPADFETPRGLPMTYLIAPDGKVAKTFLGPVAIGDLAKVIDGAATGGGAPAAPAQG